MVPFFVSLISETMFYTGDDLITIEDSEKGPTSTEGSLSTVNHSHHVLNEDFLL